MESKSACDLCRYGTGLIQDLRPSVTKRDLVEDDPYVVVPHDILVSHPSRMGELAVELLTKMLDGEKVESVVLDAQLVVRGSTGPASLRRDVPAPAPLETGAPPNVRDLQAPHLLAHAVHVDDVARLLQ